jgi:hypothetical protein
MKTFVAPYRQISDDSYLPMVWVRLGLQHELLALVDSGASVNVLPHSVGLQLGLDWDTALEGPEIGGNIAGVSKKVKLLLKIREFDALELGFCWLFHDRARVILGHDDFLKNFDVCFSTHNRVLSITKSNAGLMAGGD